VLSFFVFGYRLYAEFWITIVNWWRKITHSILLSDDVTIMTSSLRKVVCMFRIKFPTKRIFRIFPVLRTDGMAPFGTYLWNDWYYVFLYSMHYEWLHLVTFTKCLAWSHYHRQQCPQANASAHGPMGQLPVCCHLNRFAVIDFDILLLFICHVVLYSLPFI